MFVIILLLLVNIHFARLYRNLTIELCKLYVENSQILIHTVPRYVYESYLEIYQNPKSIDNWLVMHIPIYNIYYCWKLALAVIEINKIIKQNGK